MTVAIDEAGDLHTVSEEQAVAIARGEDVLVSLMNDEGERRLVALWEHVDWSFTDGGEQ